MVVTREKKLGNLNGFTGGNFAGNVYDKDMLCPTISACSGGNTQPMVVDEKEKPIVVDMYNDRQIDGDVCGTLTAHGNASPTTCGTFGVVRKETERYRIRKLTPRECWRLMNFSDEDFENAEKVVSSTQLYKEAGNSICKCVLMAIFSQMNIKGVKPWNERGGIMALTYKGKHHRNPSGFKNKVKWLLSESKWNRTEMAEIVAYIDHEKYKNWYAVYATALLNLEQTEKGDRNLRKLLVQWNKRNRNRLAQEDKDCLFRVLHLIEEGFE